MAGRLSLATHIMWILKATHKPRPHRTNFAYALATGDPKTFQDEAPRTFAVKADRLADAPTKLLPLTAQPHVPDPSTNIILGWIIAEISAAVVRVLRRSIEQIDTAYFDIGALGPILPGCRELPNLEMKIHVYKPKVAKFTSAIIILVLGHIPAVHTRRICAKLPI